MSDESIFKQQVGLGLYNATGHDLFTLQFNPNVLNQNTEASVKMHLDMILEHAKAIEKLRESKDEDHMRESSKNTAMHIANYMAKLPADS